jgi:uncharacterized small protein (DUF1192 family)
MSNLNLAFYESLIDSTTKAIDTFKGQVDRANADKEEALQLAAELEDTVALKDAEIARLKGEIEQLKSGFEADEVERLKAIGAKIEALHDVASALTNPVKPTQTETVDEAETTEDEIELDEETEDSDPVESV